MQSSSNSSRTDSNAQPVNLTKPERKMFQIELKFAIQLRQSIQQIMLSSKILLSTVTQPQTRKQKNIPYFVFRSLETLKRSVRKLKEWVDQENNSYMFLIKEQEEIKKYNNIIFREYLHALHAKKEQLKAEINDLQQKVQKTEEGNIKILEIFSKDFGMQLRFSYNGYILLSKIEYRDSFEEKVLKQLKQRKQLGIKSYLYPHFPTSASLQTLCSKELFLYRFLQNSIPALKGRNLILQKQKQIYLVGLKKIEQQKKYLKQIREVEEKKIDLTPTDYFIYFKEVKNRMDKKFRGIVWDHWKMKSKPVRSVSYPK